MPGANPPKPPHPSVADLPHHKKSRGESSSSSTAYRKSATATKSKPSPKSAATTSSNKDPSRKTPIAKPQPIPENPSPRPENPKSISGSIPVLPFNNPPPPPSYGFHMLERRSIVLADGSVRSYFALPPDYDNFLPMARPGVRPEFRGPLELGLNRPPFPVSPEFLNSDRRHPEYRNSGPENPLKRKILEDERERRDDGFARQRQQLLQYGNANGPGPSAGYSLGRGEDIRAPKDMRIPEGHSSKLKHREVDQDVLKKAFFHFVKLVFESANQKKCYLADGKQGPLACLACGRSAKDFRDTHGLVMHSYNSDENIVDHLAFHKALCILMGWNYLMPPDNSKAYQNFSAGEAVANQDDLIIWPPSVLIHNTITGKGRDGRVEGIGNRAMDSILRDHGFSTGKSMSLYSREGHLGVHSVKFSSDVSGLKEALSLAEYFERDKRGRSSWSRVQSSTNGKDDENNPDLMRPDPRTGEKKRVFYGHLATVADLDKITFDIKKKVTIVSRREILQSK